MNKKFVKVSISIIAACLIFIFGNQIIFKNLIHEEDSSNIYRSDVNIVFDKKYKTEEGIKIRIKIENPTKYIYRLEKAKLMFDQIIDSEYDNIQTSGLNIELPYPWEEDDINYKVLHDGIQPNSSEYIEFTIPKGVTLDSKYFVLDSIIVDYDGSLTVNIPFMKDTYSTIRSGVGSSTTIETVFLFNNTR